MDEIPYDIGSPDTVQKIEDELKNDLAELKAELEESNLLHGAVKNTSSVTIPKDAIHYRRERELHLQRILRVCEAMPLVVQADQMIKELKAAAQSDYNAEALPLLLHQYFVDRTYQLVQYKYMLQLRWKRFLGHTKAIEQLYPDFSQRLSDIMAEYTDCLSRAKRLSGARESYLAGDTNAIATIRIDDMYIYLRWLVCHLVSVRKFQQYMKMLEWMPVQHKKELSALNTQDALHSRHYMSVSQRQLSTTPLKSNHTGDTELERGSDVVPLHVNELKDIQPQLSALVTFYGIDMDVYNLSLSADEMELYALTVQKFRTLFLRQEHMKTFKTYDTVDSNQLNWGTDSAVHTLKKEANWLPFIKLRHEHDAVQESVMSELRSCKSIDLLLQAQSQFLKAADHDKVQEALKDHASSVRKPVVVQAVNFSSSPTMDSKSQHKVENVSSIWQKIYSNPELYKEQQKRDMNDDSDASKEHSMRRMKQTQGGSASMGNSRRGQSYDYFNAVQMLGLDDDQDSTDPASVQGGYMSFLLLRHLYVRDLQRTCLSILNYFRSVERTLTINDTGLACSDSSQVYEPTCGQNHRHNVIDGRVAAGGSLGSHHYVHNTPADYVMNETEFMQFAEVDNHDDYYTIDDDGRVHVQDQRGCYIVYDAAIDDFNTLEQDLLLVATRFIEKYRQARSNSSVAKRPTSSRHTKHQSADDVDYDINSYTHSEVDRFAVLLDMWSNEAAFLQSKKQLLDCYFEAYQNVSDRDEKRNLAQVITNIAYRRPQIDFNSDYFVHCYRLECTCLRLQTSLLQSILGGQVAEQRHYIEKICRSSEHQFGLPHTVIDKQPISIVSNKAAICDMYMLEFHNSLAIASQIPAALKQTYWELYNLRKPESVTGCLVLQKKMLEWATADWTKMPAVGSSYSKQVQKDLFSGVFADDPLFICEVAQTLVSNLEQQVAKKAQKERQVAILNCIGRVMDAVTIRHRLMDAAWETELLAKMYKGQASAMDYDECHLYLRSVQLEFAQRKDNAGKPPPVFITVVQEDESLVDRFVPNSLYLAIHELDESHVGRFSFRTRDGFLQLVRDHSESLPVILMAQVVHKNALVCAVQQVHVCHPLRDLFALSRSDSYADVNGKNDRSSSSQFLSISSLGVPSDSMLAPPSSGPQRFSGHIQRNTLTPESFVSLQLEKLPSRDLMLNEFVDKKAQNATVMKNPDEIEKLKRKVISDFCHQFSQRMTQYSLRGQIIAYYNSILQLLLDFPLIREKNFMIGEINERKDIEEETTTEPNERSFRKRVRAVMSEDGKQFFNLWFLPHHTEMLVAYKKLNDADCTKALSNHLTIAACLHDILQYLCAHSRLGSAQARLGSRANSQLTADWGGIDGIGTELMEIQKQLDNLSPKNDPQLVCLMLSLRRDVLFLEFDVAVRHSVCDTFMSTGNMPACMAVKECMHFALHDMSNAVKRTVYSTLIDLPEPIVASDSYASVLYPWRAFLLCHGPFPLQFWQWSQIEYNMRLCLSGLKDVDRQVANAEILNMSLLMEEVLNSGPVEKGIFTTNDEEGPDNRRRRVSVSVIPNVPLNLSGGVLSNRISLRQQPVEAYRLLKCFLLLWKRLEVLKRDWGLMKLGVADINTYSLYSTFCKEYRKEILQPVMQIIARRSGNPDFYEGLSADQDSLVAPQGVSEMEIKMRQVIKLLERFEIQMISEVKKRIQKELTLALAECARDENVLPTDLWKRPAIKESFTLTRSDIAENFIAQLKSVCEEDSEKITFSNDHLNSCLNSLAGSIMAREKLAFENYSTYYENLLRANHQLLYQKEQEVKQLKDQLKLLQNTAQVEVECRLADSSQNLLLEVTALRCKVSELQENRAALDSEIRTRVRQEYNALVQGLFKVVFDLNHRLDEIRKEISDGVFDRIAEIRSEATEAMTRLAQRNGASTDVDSTQRNLSTAGQIRELQLENHRIYMLLMKQQMLGKWRLSCQQVLQHKKLVELQQKAEGFKKERVREELKFMREKQFLSEQLKAIRGALKASQMECDLIRKELDIELREKTDQSHVSQQQALSLKKLEEARLEKIKQLHADLEDKNEKLQQLSEGQEKARMQQLANQEKIKRDIEMVRKQLNHERTLKKDAFQRVDQLQAELTDIENVGTLPSSRPATSFSTTMKSSRVSSAMKSSSTQRIKSAGWRPQTQWPRCMTAGPSELAARQQQQQQQQQEKKIQRPKSSIISLRSRLAEQLLHDLQPPSHQEILLKISRVSGDP